MSIRWALHAGRTLVPGPRRKGLGVVIWYVRSKKALHPAMIGRPVFPNRTAVAQENVAVRKEHGGGMGGPGGPGRHFECRPAAAWMKNPGAAKS